MKYIHIETKKYPLTESEIRSMNPNVSFPAPFNPGEQYAVVFPTPQPDFNAVTHTVVELAPKLSSKNNYEQQWEVRSKFQEYTDDQGVLHTVESQEQKALLEDNARKAELLIQSIVNAVQKRLDDFAKTRNYDGILSACTYATSMLEKFRKEGQYCVTARDNTWAVLYQILEEVNSGVRPAPTGYHDIEPDLPELAWGV